MKKHLILLAGLLMGFAFTSCNDDDNDQPQYELRVLTFEDQDYKAGTYRLDYCDKTISTWSDLIPEVPGGSVMLNGTKSWKEPGDATYRWSDEGNTLLAHAFVSGDRGSSYGGGGHAVSNYLENDLSKGDYPCQLCVYNEKATVGAAGHNGSKNFCVQNGYNDNTETTEIQNLPALKFEDGVERVIDHMWVTSTTYALNCYNNGNQYSAPVAEGDYVKIIAKGYGANKEYKGKLEFVLAEGTTTRVKEWTKWDLSKLGKVAMIEFNVASSVKNEYGMTQPGYFAYDDVAVRFDK